MMVLLRMFLSSYSALSLTLFLILLTRLLELCELSSAIWPIL
jgi:hypothetical protein